MAESRGGTYVVLAADDLVLLALVAGFLGVCTPETREALTSSAEAEAFWERVLRAEASTTRDVRSPDLAFLYECLAGSSLGDLLRVLVGMSLDREEVLSSQGAVVFFTGVFGFLAAGFFV